MPISLLKSNRSARLTLMKLILRLMVDLGLTVNKGGIQSLVFTTLCKIKKKTIVTHYHK